MATQLNLSPFVPDLTDLFTVHARHFNMTFRVGKFSVYNLHCTPVAQLVEHQAFMWEVVSLTLAGPSITVLK